ncbi:MAG: hypothetical protein C5B59_09395 [Bacteroidetes bacterium]|nr:MAG: hypothetical protein C5B59_09395 [Bacteroidota bacterium]
MKNSFRAACILLPFMAFLTCQGQQFTIEPVPPVFYGQPTAKIHVEPNPVHRNSFFYLQIDSCELNDTDRVVIYNSTGFMIQSRVIRMQAGLNRFIINISGFEPGSYVVKIFGRNAPNYTFSQQITVEM